MLGVVVIGFLVCRKLVGVGNRPTVCGCIANGGVGDIPTEVWVYYL